MHLVSCHLTIVVQPDVTRVESLDLRVGQIVQRASYTWSKLRTVRQTRKASRFLYNEDYYDNGRSTAVRNTFDLVVCDTDSTKRKLTQGKCGIGIGMVIVVTLLFGLFTRR